MMSSVHTCHALLYHYGLYRLSSVASVKRPPADFPENSVPEKMSTVKPQVLSQWSGARRPALALIDDLSCYC